MEPNLVNQSQGKTSALDFFLHLGAIIALYVVVGNFINLLFRIIDRAFPTMITNGYYWTQGSELSFPVATLIITFPVFVIVSWLTHKTYETHPEKKNLGIRKWLTYLTLFFAGIFLAGDLVAVLYKFLDGQDLTTAFLLKALVVLVVSASVFGFYLQDIRDRVSAQRRKVWAIAIALIIIVAIILGFSVIGSPKTQRLLREDNLAITDLQNIEGQIISYWTMNGMIPSQIPENTFTSKELGSYTYKKTGDMSFEICANFNLSSSGQGRQQGMMAEIPMGGRKGMGNGFGNHGAGMQCFERLIDPALYPTQVRG